MVARSVDEYIAHQPEAVQALLELVRATLHDALPGAEESIRYQMPAVGLDGHTVLSFAAWGEHWSLYPIYGAAVAALEAELAPYRAHKDTLRFPLDAAVPRALIARIARLKAAEHRAPATSATKTTKTTKTAKTTKATKATKTTKTTKKARNPDAARAR